MKPTLLVLAAGMGSRYGGLKQIDGVGPHGETIMDYSVYDALRAGFGKIVFVIRKDFEADFRRAVASKYENHISIEVVFQSLTDLPQGFTCPEERVKPWGTNHALLMGAPVIHEAFAVINADDYYGRDSFEVMARYLCGLEGSGGEYGMVGFHVGNTLSESGAVARGVCACDSCGFLTDIVERTAVERKNGVVSFPDENGMTITCPDDTLVSMNFWGFTPDYFGYSEDSFKRFLAGSGANLKAEFFIPMVVNELIKQGKARVKVLETSSKWFGVTYAADRPNVVARLLALHESGVYPERLFA